MPYGQSDAYGMYQQFLRLVDLTPGLLCVSHQSDFVHSLRDFGGHPGQGKGMVSDHLKQEESLMSCFKVSKVSDNQMG